MDKQIIEQLDRIEKLLTTAFKPKPMTVDEVCLYLNISKSYLYKLTFNRKIPYYKPLGKRIYFNKEQLDEFIYKNRVKTDEELNEEANIYIKKHPFKDITRFKV